MGVDYDDIYKAFTGYLKEKNLRQTEERCIILKHICSFGGHFDINTLYEKLEEGPFHVSKATLYNSLDLYVEAGIVVKHQFTPQSVQFELRALANTHQHLICTKCHSVSEVSNRHLLTDLKQLKIRRFTPEYYCMYIFGVCSKCAFKLNREKKIPQAKPVQSKK
jgi:Fur family ferric uptake transcriptional regulator